ncbi:hypothetical protein BGZ50_002765 [Haplosporangium sp. Z 11]|nr:hypothetical protein BGZ50_002765 [Haplosporangium sp. Z 11]
MLPFVIGRYPCLSSGTPQVIGTHSNSGPHLMPPEPLGPLNDRKTSRRDSRISSRAIEPPSAMATKLQSKPTKSESLASEATLDSNNDEILPKRHLGKNAGAVGSTQVEPHDMDGPSNRSSEESSEDRDVAAQLEKKRLEHEHQRNMKREQFEQQMQQLEIQQLQEEQAMLASKSRNSVTATNPITELSQGLVSIRSLPVSRRNSNDGVDPWSDIEKLSLGGDKSKRSVELPKLGRSSTMKDGNLSPSESTFDDNTHLNQFTERFIFDDDSTAGTGSRLNSLQRSIWKDQQDLGTGSSAIGGSYLPRYLQIGANDNDDFPTMRPSSSSALDLAQIPHTSGLRHPGTHDLGRNSEWPQFNQTLPSTSERHGSIIGFTGVGNTKDSLKTTLPKLTPAYSSSEIPTRFNKAPSLTPFDDMPETDSRGLLKSEMNSSDVCLQFQQGHCPRGDMCPYAHTNILPSTSRPSAGMPLSPGVGMSVGSVSFYSRMNSLSGAGSSSGLTNVTGFPFSTVQNGGGFELPSTGSNNVPRMQQQQQQQVNGGSSKGNQKRAVVDVEANRFAGAMLESFVGQIYSLCKDQHGCRYLQKKLEEQNETYLTIIFGEVFGHFVELMTDPFGNYLCQKLLEFCGDDQRTAIVETVAPELVNISLNMHGTRAVQKMIEFLSTPQQIAIVVVALNPSVVTLIKDLNGNHVIQKCLNRLASEDNQFIYNAISTHCIEVATHRHGCCVLQRCIDHASVSQKLQLVREITFNALVLVQDPFGNYVVQYVLDLADSRFTDSLIRRFIGNVCALSVQKFSSNVMEKCIRVSEPETRKFLIEEMINKSRLEKMLRDSYANYVVQTSLDFADPIQRAQLVECIRPLLPAIRNTPYGKRIQSKLHRDQLSSANQLGHLNLNAMGAMNGMNGMSGMGGINGMAGMGNMGNLNSMTGLGNMGNMSNLNGMGMGNMSGMPSSMAMNMANLANSMNNMSLMNGMPMGNMPNMNNMSGMPGAMNNSNMNGMNNGTNMSGMPNAMNNNMMGFGFPGMNHYGNVGMIGMNDYNPYNGYM